MNYSLSNECECGDSLRVVPLTLKYIYIQPGC